MLDFGGVSVTVVNSRRGHFSWDPFWVDQTLMQSRMVIDVILRDFPYTTASLVFQSYLLTFGVF